MLPTTHSSFLPGSVAMNSQTELGSWGLPSGPPLRETLTQDLPRCHSFPLSWGEGRVHTPRTKLHLFLGVTTSAFHLCRITH